MPFVRWYAMSPSMNLHHFGISDERACMNWVPINPLTTSFQNPAGLTR